MAETTQFELVTPARVMVSAEVEMVTAPGSEGQFGVLARHAPVIANLQITSSYMIDGGLADVTGDKVVILAQRAEDLNKVTAAELRERANGASEADAAFLNAAADQIAS